jgi:glycosyltransferase involved in cell wall biosynthesis
MGWNWIRALATRHDVTVIIGEKDDNRCAIMDYLYANPEYKSSLQPHFIPRPLPDSSAHNPLAYYREYNRWHHRAYRVAQELCISDRYDLTHQLNMIGYREPGYLWKLPLPFIWGPVGGFVQMPWSFMRILGLKGAAFYSARNIINSLQMHLSIRVRTAMRRADAVLAATREDRLAIQKHFGKAAILLNETGVTLPPVMPLRCRYNKDRALKLCWCGLLLGRKALPLTLHALSRLRRELRVELDVIGDGPECKRWVALAKKLGLDSIVRWHGWVNHDEALRIISQSDAMLFTSFQEGTPAVVMEALSFGVPVICHDLCGFGTVVDETCGIKISVKGPRQSIEGFACAIRNLADDPALLARLSASAISRASELTWERKVDAMESVYFKTLETQTSHDFSR